MREKVVLDACCGSRMFWFDKQNPMVVFADNREEEHILCDGRTLKITPDLVSDFRNMPFADKQFKLVVFDPPHLLKLGKNSWMAKKYGLLQSETWQEDISKGFNECMRVLDDYGVLVFKWNQRDIKISTLLKAIGTQPLFGHTTRKNSETTWMCFIKSPKSLIKGGGK